MKVVLRAKAKNEKQRDEIYEVLGLIAEKEHIQVEERGELVIMKVCPQGTLECREQGGEICISADTTLGGPGFMPAAYAYWTGWPKNARHPVR